MWLPETAGEAGSSPTDMFKEEFSAIAGTPRELRVFRFSLGTAACAATAILVLKTRIWLFAGIAPAAVLLLAVLPPAAITPAYRSFARAGIVAAWLVSRLFFALFFFTGFTAIGFLARRSGSRLIERGFRSGQGSYWIPRPRAVFDRSRYEKQF